MSHPPVWLTEANVTSLIDLNGAIDGLERVLSAEAAGDAANMAKAHLMVGDNDAMHAIGGAVGSDGICGTKTWVNVAGKSSTLLILFSLEDGACRAVIEATALGQLRTAAMTGVGTKWLAPDYCNEMAIIGTGKQALPQVAGCRAVRDLERVRIFSRSAEHRNALASQIAAEFVDLDVVIAGSVEEAVAGAPLITLCTNATEPFLSADMVAAGSHLNAVGAIVPKRVEFTQDIFPRCALVAADSVEAVRNLSREFMDYYGSDETAWQQVQPISKIVGEKIRRPGDADLTLFKPMGMGISDLAVGIEVLKRSESQGAGHPLPERVRQSLPLQAAE